MVARMKKTILTVCMLAGVMVSCTIWSQREWERVENKKFVLTSFVYINKAAERESAFDFIKAFPVADVASVLQGKFGIAVDTAEFDSFFSNEKNCRALEVSGILFRERFAWTAKKAESQSVEIEYAYLPVEESTDMYRSWTVRVLSDQKLRAVFTDDVEDYRDVAASLAGKLGVSTKK
jgi:hypothetical protein